VQGETAKTPKNSAGMSRNFLKNGQSYFPRKAIRVEGK